MMDHSQLHEEFEAAGLTVSAAQEEGVCGVNGDGSPIFRVVYNYTDLDGVVKKMYRSVTSAEFTDAAKAAKAQKVLDAHKKQRGE